MLISTNRLISDSWLNLIILGLIIEKLITCTLTFQGPGTIYPLCHPLVGPA